VGQFAIARAYEVCDRFWTGFAARHDPPIDFHGDDIDRHRHDWLLESAMRVHWHRFAKE
jgi:hypothetical protein